MPGAATSRSHLLGICALEIVKLCNLFGCKDLEGVLPLFWGIRVPITNAWLVRFRVVVDFQRIRDPKAQMTNFG